MNHLENITRHAARAIGVKEENYTWENAFQFLRAADETGRETIFGPLLRLEDAYRLEDALRLNVRYICKEAGAEGIHDAYSIQVSADCGGSTFTSVQGHSSTLAARMYAVTQFATLHAIMQDDANESALREAFVAEKAGHG